jgi:hypothetical protein
MAGGGLMSVASHNRVRVRVPMVGFIVGEVRRIWEEGAVAGSVVGGGAGGRQAVKKRRSDRGNYDRSCA